MFDEVESEALNLEPLDDEEVITVPEHLRKRGKRLKLPPHLPRVEVIIDLENKFCPTEGEEVSEKLEIIPGKVRVVRTIKKKYACPACESLTTAPSPEEKIPKSNASA
jgi:transposase